MKRANLEGASLKNCKFENISSSNLCGANLEGENKVNSTSKLCGFFIFFYSYFYKRRSFYIFILQWSIIRYLLLLCTTGVVFFCATDLWFSVGLMSAFLYDGCLLLFSTMDVVFLSVIQLWQLYQNVRNRLFYCIKLRCKFERSDTWR